MGFDNGSVNLRMFYLREPFTVEMLDAFARDVIPPINTLGAEPLHGWIGPSHALDRDFSEEHCSFTAYLHLSYLTAEKKIPPSTLRAYVKQEEEVEKKAREIAFLPRAVKTEVKERITAMLLTDALPSFASIPFVVDMRNKLLLCAAMSDNATDAFAPFFKGTTGTMPILITAETAALSRHQVNAKDLIPVNYTPNPAIEVPYEVSLGNDFFTWLLFFWEHNGGTFDLDGTVGGMMIEGPLLMYAEGPGAYETVLRKGTPLDSRELGVALYCGKKLKRAKVTFTCGETIVSSTIDADDFSFRGMKLPKSEQDDSVGIFQERMAAVELFRECWLTLFDQFITLRTNNIAWRDALEEIRAWIEARANPPSIV